MQYDPIVAAGLLDLLGVLLSRALVNLQCLRDFIACRE
jgi:hypothetical protein